MEESYPPRSVRGYGGDRGRSPSPYRRNTRRSPSPYRRERSPIRRRQYSRSRSPYRRRSPPPYRRRYHSRSRSPRRYGRRSPPRYPVRRPARPVYRGSEEDRAKTCSIFVGNIPYGYEERDISNMFERFGKIVSISVPIDRYTHRNRGFSFVQFEHRADAEEAFAKFENYELEGRALRLDWDVGVGVKERARGRSPIRDRSQSPHHGSPMRRSLSPVRSP